MALILVWTLLVASTSFAVEIENRPLLPTSTTRSPAEAGLESGRYEEIPIEKLEEWERQQERNAKTDIDAKVESNFSKSPAGR